jgi:hypothetical protein
MAIALLLWGGFSAFVGFMFFAGARSAVHEIEAGLGFLIATVAIGCAGIIDAVKHSRPQSPSPSPSPVKGEG